MSIMIKEVNMKIAIPVDNNTNGNISVSFGRAPYFIFIDTDKNVSEYIINDAANSQGGAGIKAAQIIVDKKADALITPRCGENAANVLKAAGIEIYKSNSSSVEENLRDLKDKRLNLLTEIHQGFHGHGGR